jgi:uncharacterized protein YlbG (UPF0298 family)
MRAERQGIIVWFQNRRNIKQIKRYGHLIYTSKKLKYAVLYVDQDKIDDIENKLKKLSFISKIDRSHKPFIRTNFEKVTPDKDKKYDYNMGI